MNVPLTTRWIWRPFRVIPDDSTPKQVSKRAGQYIRQLQGYAAFNPVPRPPDPPLRLFDRPIRSVEAIAKVTDLTFRSPNKRMRRLVTLGILQEITGHKRNRLFSYASSLSMFDAPGTADPAAGNP